MEEAIVNKVAVMVDTVSQMSQEIADKYDIKLMPMGIVIEGKTYPDTEINLTEYYEQLPKWKEAGKLPTTCSINVWVFLETYRELSQKAEAILYISHSAKLGMSPNAALQARAQVQAELPQTAIEVIDSATACGAEMLIAIEAARAAAAGKSLSEVVEVANNMVKTINHIHLSDNLYYLAKGGRIHKARPWAGSNITNTALLEMDASAGKMHAPLARYGTKRKAVEGLLEIMKERYRDKKLHVVINHSNVPDEADELKNGSPQNYNALSFMLLKPYR
jgi:DegV family protein with EDD domain